MELQLSLFIRLSSIEVFDIWLHGLYFCLLLLIFVLAKQEAMDLLILMGISMGGCAPEV